MSTALVLLAAGDGRRVGGEVNKVMLPLAGRPVFTWSLTWAESVPGIDTVLLVIRERDRARATASLARELPHLTVSMIEGGANRHESEWRALTRLAPEIRSGAVDVVVIHDAARPLARTSLFAQVIDRAREVGGALPGVDQPSLAPLDPDADPPVERTVAVQTPQAFRALPLLDAYEQAAREGFVGSDTAACIERFSDLDVFCCTGRSDNIKITFADDLRLAEHLLAQAHGDDTT